MYSSNKQRVFAILHAERDSYIRVTEHVKESYIVRVPRAYHCQWSALRINLQNSKRHSQHSSQGRISHTTQLIDYTRKYATPGGLLDCSSRRLRLKKRRLPDSPA